jgi:hypothetical protein
VLDRIRIRHAGCSAARWREDTAVRGEEGRRAMLSARRLEQMTTAIHQREKYRHLFGPAVLVAALLLGQSTAATAQLLPVGPPVTKNQSSTAKDQPFSDFNRCTGENFSGLGHLHSQFIDRSTPTVVKTTFRAHQNGKGTAAITLNQYQYQAWSENDFESSNSNFTTRIEERKHMIRLGPNANKKDDFFMREVLVISFVNGFPSESVESFRPEDQCR